MCEARHSGPDGLSGSSSSTGTDCGSRGTEFNRPAYEANGGKASVNDIVRMYFGYQNEYLFVQGIASASKACTHIMFEIISGDCVAKSALVRVLEVNCDCDTLQDCTLEVFDRLGCVFDEPNADLKGRKGYAISMKRPSDCVESSTSSSSSSSSEGGCEWQVLTLCCFDGAC